MASGKEDQKDKSNLRKKAEIIAKSSYVDPSSLSEAETAHLIQQLQVHQIELRLQNEELRSAHLALKEVRDRYADLYEFAPVAYFIINAQGNIIEANLTGVSLLGVERTSLIDSNLSRYVFPDDQDIFYFSVNALKKTRRPQSCQIRLVKSDKSKIFVHLEISAVLKDDGTSDLWRAVISDINDEKIVEGLRLQSFKNASMTTFAGGIAHDLNNLLTTIQLETSRVLNELPSDHSATAHLKRALTSVTKAAILADKMLAFSGQGRFQLGAVQLTEFIKKNTGTFASLIKPDISLLFDLDPDLPTIKADETQIYQVIWNLIQNAMEAYQNKEGAITIRTKPLEVESDYSSQILVDSPIYAGIYACVEISDNGSGIDDEIMPYVFDPFFTTKEVGRGLGLSVVQGIVKGHHGDILINSSEACGTTITILFPGAPVTETLITSTKTTEIQKTPAELDTNVILIVDDDAELRESLGDYLSYSGWTVLLAGSGFECLQVYSENSDVISLVLLDLTMPGMNGVEVLHALRSQKPDLPILIMSGFDEKEVQLKFSEGEIQRFIKKPFDVDVLKKTINEITT